MASLSLKHIYKVYDGTTKAVNDFNMEIRDREFIVFVGPSGCGKSTLLSIIAGTLSPTAGQVTIAGKPVEGPSPHIGYMLQQDNLLEWRTVRQNVAFSLAVKGAILLLSAFGIANMWIAIFGDVGVAVLAILNAMRALWSK